MRLRPLVARFIFLVLRFAVGLIPACLVAIIGCAYLIQNATTLLAPGVPVELQYEGADGTVTARLQTYSIDPWSQVVSGTDLSLASTTGAKADVGAFQASIQKGVPSVVLHELKATLRRSKTGSLDLQSLGLKPDGKPDTSKLNLEVSSSQIEFIQDGERPLPIRLNNIKAAGSHGHWAIKGLVATTNLASLPFQVDLSPKGSAWVKATFQETELRGVLEELTSRKVLSDLRAESILANGTLGVAIEGDRTLATGDGVLAFRNVSYRDLVSGLTGTANLRTTADRSTVELRAASGEANLVAKGEVFPSPNLQFELTSKTLAPIPASFRKQIPVSAQGIRASGRVRQIRNETVAMVTVQADSAKYDTITAKQLEWKAVLNGQNWSAEWVKGEAEGIPIEARLSGNLAQQSINGWIAPKGDVSSLLEKYLPNNVTLQASGNLIVAGTLSKPKFAGFASGEGAIKLESGKTITLDEVQVKLGEADGGIGIDFLAKSKGGRVYASAAIKDFKSQAISGSWAAQWNDFSIVADDASGEVYGSGELGGTVRDPVVSGTLQAIDLKASDQWIPVATSGVLYRNQNLSLHTIEAISLGGLITGSVTANLENQTLAGDLAAKGLSLARLKLEDTYGLVDIDQAILSGTFEKPSIRSNFSILPGLIAGYRVDKGLGQIALQDQKLKVTGASVFSGKGEVKLELDFDTQSQLWVAKADVKDADLAQYLSRVPDSNLAGLINATGTVTGVGTKVNSGQFSGSASDLAAFDQNIGSGPIEGKIVDGQLELTANVGNLDRYVFLNPLVVKLATGEATLSADVTNLTIKEVYESAISKSERVDSKIRELVAKLDAQVSASVKAKWDGTNLEVEVPTLVADSIAYDESPLGKLVASVKVGPNRATVDKLEWASNESRLTANGNWTKDGPIEGKFNLTNLDASLLKSIFPKLPVTSGSIADFTGEIRGTDRDPIGQGSLSIVKAQVTDSVGENVAPPIDISLYRIDYRNRELVTEGDFTVGTPDKVSSAIGLNQFVRGLTGTIEATVPLDSLIEKPTAKFEAKVALSSARPISSLAAYFPGLDPEQSTGDLIAFVRAFGDVTDPHLEGVAELVGRQGSGANLVFRNSAMKFSGVDAKLTLTEDSLKVNAKAKSGTEGSMGADLSAKWPSLFDQNFSIDRLMEESQVQGNLVMKSLDAGVTLPKAVKPSSARLDGQLRMAGSIRVPEISGNVNISRLYAALPLGFEEPPPASKPEIDPKFKNILVTLSDDGFVDAAAAKLNMNGQGDIRGSLSDPIIRFRSDIIGGSVRLLTNRIRVEEGSTLDFLMLGSGSPPRLDLDVKGRANVTYRQGSDQYQSYSLDLSVKGDLLSQSPLQIRGTSDPPGLTDEQIAGIIGERQFFETLAGSATGGRNDEALRNTFYSVALPSVSDFLTEPVAVGLGLDYLNLDYNPFDQTVLNAGKSLSRDLLLQYTRQLIQPTSGPRREELRLSYRLPVKNRFLTQLRLSLVKNQIVPWRFEISWSQRF